MKIAIIVPYYKPKWVGGTEIATASIARLLSRKGHQVHIITSLDAGLPSESIDEGVLVHRVPLSKKKIIGVVTHWTGIFNQLKKIRPDVVHAQSIHIGVPAVIARIFLKMPCLAWGQGSEIYLPASFKNWILKLVYKYADVVIALTDDMKREINRVYKREVVVLPNGIELERFANISRALARQKLGLHEQQKVLMFTGNLRPVKGVKYLVQAMPALLKADSDIALLIIGDGPEKADLTRIAAEAGVTERVIFYGRVPNAQIPEYLAAADVFVLPSLSEGFPVTIIEAMACGLPVITTRVRGLPEIVKEGLNGYLAEPENSLQLAQKISLLVSDAGLRNAISRRNRSEAQQYAWENIVERLETIYSQISTKYTGCRL